MNTGRLALHVGETVAQAGGSVDTVARRLCVRGPGMAWLPAVLRQAATWRTVWRFTWAGPLIGCVPYAWMLISIPVAYVIGAAPAALAGLLFAAWYHAPGGRVPTWPWRAAIGALSGAGAAGVVLLAMLLRGQPAELLFAGVVAAHGVPAAMVLALLQRPACPHARAQPRRALGEAV